jgi:PIN domain nuclease of toxin-antitoxin system
MFWNSAEKRMCRCGSRVVQLTCLAGALMQNLPHLHIDRILIAHALASKAHIVTMWE